MPVPHVRLEFPLLEGVGNGFRLIRKGAEKVNMFYLAFFVDDDPDRNRIEPALGENRIDPRNHVLTLRVILNAHWNIAPAPPVGLASADNSTLFSSSIRLSSSFVSRLVSTNCTAWQRISVASTYQ